MCVFVCVQVQIATLMQLQGTRTDPAQLERLQSMLTEKNEEIHNLVTKLQRLEKSQVTYSMTLTGYLCGKKLPNVTTFRLCVCVVCVAAVKVSAICTCPVRGGRPR